MIINIKTFQNCTNLTTITIPSSVKSIVAGAFYNCGRISSVYISDLAAWCNITFLNGKYNYVSKETANPFYSNNEHHLYLNGKEVTNLDISQEATIIHEKAFYNCKSITSVTIPNSVTNIESAAFSGCSGLTSVTIPNSVTEIGSGAFSGCDNLLTVSSEITEPFNCKDAFSTETLRKGTLKVPAGTKDLYIRFDGWREFLKIEEVGSAEPQQYFLSS